MFLIEELHSFIHLKLYLIEVFGDLDDKWMYKVQISLETSPDITVPLLKVYTNVC